VQQPPPTSILRLEESGAICLSYSAQQASGSTTGLVMKSTSRKHSYLANACQDGVTAALMVHDGFTGLSDPFSGENNLLEITSPHFEAGNIG